MNADLQTIDGRPALRLERYLAHPLDRVWRAVSEPAEVRRWMPAAADWTLALGAEFELGGQHGQITELDPPHLIGWTFGADRFRFTLQAKGDGCALVFTHIFDDAAPAAQTAAGWECYLDRLDAQLAGRDLSEERAHQPVGERHERYAARFGLDPAPGRAFIASLGFRGLSLEDGPALRLERRYDQPAERVWRALTEPDELSRWFPGEFEITHSDPPHLLIGGWQGDGTLRFELRADGAGCVLTFTHAFTDRDQAALTGAGWDRCFARLDALLAGQTMTYDDSLAAWPQLHERLAAAWGIDPGIGRAVYAEHTAEESVKPLPDLESAHPLRRFGLHADILHGGEPGAVARPFHQGVDRFGGSLEDGLDAAVGEVPHPPAHGLTLGRPTARVAERHPLHQPGDQHPIANHTSHLPRSRRASPAEPTERSSRHGIMGDELSITAASYLDGPWKDETMTPTDTDTDVRRELLECLEYQRASVRSIVEGMDEDAWHTPVVASGWTVAGIVEHLGNAERHWFQEVVAGLREDQRWDEGRPPYDPAMAFTCDRPPPEVLGYYRAQCDRADAIVAGVGLSDAPLGSHGGEKIANVRVVILHMIEETAAHSGHLEIARELLDGKTGLGLR